MPCKGISSHKGPQCHLREQNPPRGSRCPVPTMGCAYSPWGSPLLLGLCSASPWQGCICLRGASRTSPLKLSCVASMVLSRTFEARGNTPKHESIKIAPCSTLQGAHQNHAAEPQCIYAYRVSQPELSRETEPRDRLGPSLSLISLYQLFTYLKDWLT